MPTTPTKKIPDDMGEFMGIFTKLCENFADEYDEERKSKKHQNALLDFCHAYAYKVNGVQSW